MNSDLAAIHLIQQTRFKYKLDQFTDQQLASINKTLTKVENEILHEWGKVGMRTPFQQSRGIALLEETRALTRGVKASLTQDIARGMGQVSEESAKFHSKLLSFGGRAANVNEVRLTAEQMASMWQTTPLKGRLLGDWVTRSFDHHTIDKIQQELTTGMFRGESYAALGKRLSVGFGMTKNEVDTLVRTFVQTANNDARQKVYEANADLISELRWTVAVDKSVCLLCAALDGKRFPVDSGPRPPSHHRCRCVTTPELKSLKELGLSSQDVKEYQAEERIDPCRQNKGYQGRRLFEGDGRVADNMGQWLRQLPMKEQRDYFGPKRLSLLESGAVQFEDLVDLDQLRIKTLAELVPGKDALEETLKKGAALVAAREARQPTPEENEVLLSLLVWRYLEGAALGHLRQKDRLALLKKINQLEKRLGKKLSTPSSLAKQGGN